MYGNPVTVTNTPQTYDRQEVEGDNSNSAEIVDVPQPAVEQPDNDLQKGYDDFLAEINKRRQEVDNSNYFMDAVAKRLYRMPTEEEQKRIDRRNKARTTMAGVADALRILGQGIGASGGGIVNVDRGSLSDANNARYAHYKQEHEDKLAKNNLLLIDAQNKDMQYKLRYKELLDKMLADYRENLIKQGASVKAAEEKTKQVEAQIAYKEEKDKADREFKRKENEENRTFKSKENEEKRKTDLRIANMRTSRTASKGSGGGASNKYRNMVLDNATVTFPNTDGMTDFNRRFLVTYANIAKKYTYYKELQSNNIDNIQPERMAQIVQEMIKNDPQIRDEYLLFAEREGYEIKLHSKEDDDSDVVDDKASGDYLRRLAGGGEKSAYPYALGQSPEDYKEEDFTNYKRK